MASTGGERLRRHQGRWRAIGLAISALTVVAFLAGDSLGAEQRPWIGLSSLIFHLDGEEQAGRAKLGLRRAVLEWLAEGELRGVDAGDTGTRAPRTARPALLLEGIIREFECLGYGGGNVCRIGVEWKLRDPERRRVVYRVMTRHRVAAADSNRALDTGRALIRGALRSLMSRERFRKFVATPGEKPTVPEEDLGAGGNVPVGTAEVSANADIDPSAGTEPAAAAVGAGSVPSAGAEPDASAADPSSENTEPAEPDPLDRTPEIIEDEPDPMPRLYPGSTGSKESPLGRAEGRAGGATEPRAPLEDRARTERERAEREKAARQKALREREKKEKAERQRRIDALTPGFVPVLKWGGVVLAGAGAVAAVASSEAVDRESSTERDFERFRLLNDAGWIAVGVGAAAFTTSFFFVPSLPEKGPRTGGVGLSLSPARIKVGVWY